MSRFPGNSSGEGSRPTTDGGTDNIGAAKGFDPARPEDNVPAPRERMQDVRNDRARAAGDDSAPLGMTDSARPEPNTEPEKTARENNEQR
ncbi:MAG: hypothetical protein EOO28_33645 [Comamonadaceae bacterium]|nr:MAG: hypothetical protein EOO28_33645 [Comamonadaceae bacterium]